MGLFDFVGNALGIGGAANDINAAASQIQFNPWNVSSGLGTAAFGPDNQATAALSPELQALSQQLQGIGSNYLGMTNPAFAQQLGQQAGQTGQGFLSQLNTFDPFAAAETQFNRLEDILAPSRQQNRDALQSQLLRQGRLGSTGGSLQQQALEDAIQKQSSTNLVNAFQQAQQSQAQMANIGQNLSAFGAQQAYQPFGLGLQALQQGVGLQSLPLQQLQLGGAFGGQAMDAASQRAGLQAQAASLMPSFTGGLLSGGLTGWASTWK